MVKTHTHTHAHTSPGRAARVVVVVLSPGEFEGDVKLTLPVGSLLSLAGHGADLVQHCVPAVRAPRVSVTLRKMRRAFEDERRAAVVAESSRSTDSDFWGPAR